MTTNAQQNSLLEIGDKAISCYRSIEGVISSVLNGKVAGCIHLTFCDDELADFFIHTGILQDLDVPHKSIVVGKANGHDDYEIDFKAAGKRLQGKMKEAKAKFEAGDRSDFLDSEIRKKSRLSGDIIAFHGGVRIDFDLDNDDEFIMAINARRSIKKYVTETLGIEIVPALWRDPDEVVGNVRILTVIMCDGSEKIYQALEKYAPVVFCNTLMNFRLATRSEIFQGKFFASHVIEFEQMKIGLAIYDKALGEYI